MRSESARTCGERSAAVILMRWSLVYDHAAEAEAPSRPRWRSRSSYRSRVVSSSLATSSHWSIACRTVRYTIAWKLPDGSSRM